MPGLRRRVCRTLLHHPAVAAAAGAGLRTLRAAVRRRIDRRRTGCRDRASGDDAVAAHGHDAALLRAADVWTRGRGRPAAGGCPRHAAAAASALRGRPAAQRHRGQRRCSSSMTYACVCRRESGLPAVANGGARSRVFVRMLDFDGSAHGHSRPASSADARERGQRHKARVQAGSGAEPTGQRIGDQPAGMRQRELRGEQRRPVFRRARAAQQPPGGRLHQRVAQSEAQPQRQQRRVAARARAARRAGPPPAAPRRRA